MEEGNADDTDDDEGNDYDEMDHLVDNVLGNDDDEDDDDYDTVTDDNINSKDNGSGKVNSNNEEEEFFPVFKEEEGVTVATME